ncbi:MAG: LPP20 family lipoprotein [Selenomonadaceae bacterium]|nr:LPP20 family lipoprotein [Selenomonadaceae bacterium]
MLMLAMMATTAFAEKGTVDWNKGVIRAMGIGAGKSTTKNPGLYRAQARRAAIMDAQRNLAETVKGVRVTSDSTMEDLELKYDVVRTQVDAIIKGMNEVSSQLMDDGTYEVVLEMPIFGAADSLSDAAFLPFKDEPKVSFPQPSTSTSVTVNYTGLIIDCRGMNLNCVMSPVIKNDNNQAIYGHQNLDYDKIIVNGMASYANSAEDEISRSRAGNNPLIVKAVNLADLNANPVVSTADADKILAANRQGKFLENCAVVFVY